MLTEGRSVTPLCLPGKTNMEEAWRVVDLALSANTLSSIRGENLGEEDEQVIPPGGWPDPVVAFIAA